MKSLFRPIDIASLVFFRIIFAVLGFMDVLSSYVYYHLEKDAFNPEKFQFYYYGFAWVRVFADPWMTLFFITLLLLAIFIGLGFWYRGSCILFFLGFTYLFLLEKANYLNHGYLFCWICFVMIFVPAHKAFSLDVWRKKVIATDLIPYWPLFLLQFLMGIVYFFGGLAKINEDWLRAVPLSSWLPSRASTPLIGCLLEMPETAYFMAYGGVLFDLMIIPLLLFRQTRLWAFGLALFFHLTNAMIFNIGIFPYLSIGLTALFFTPDFPRRIVDKSRPLIAALGQRLGSFNVFIPTTRAPLYQATTPSPPTTGFIKTAILLFVFLHVLIPLRHHLFAGPVSWTEEGHRYAWRMMLRAKTGSGLFVVEDLDSGQKEKIKPSDYLWSKQERKLYTHPDMILQFAHYLQKKYKAMGKKVAIYADITVQLNDHPKQYYIDPAQDLTLVQWHFFQSATWIRPADF
ncbi:MAG: HTTM domain-containing protein [Saprospiraceae bacterium]